MRKHPFYVLSIAIVSIVMALTSCDPQLEPKQYTVTFDANGAEGTAPTEINVTEGETFTVPRPTNWK